MAARKSYINKAIIRNDLKSFASIMYFYLFFLILALPLRIILYYRSAVYNQLDPNELMRLLSLESGFYYILIIFMPIVVATYFFHYLHSASASNSMYAMPVSRGVLFNSHVACGLIMLYVPIIIVGMLCQALILYWGDPGIPENFILLWLLKCLILSTYIFLVSVWMATVSGTYKAQAVLSILGWPLPLSITQLVTYTLGTLLPGYPAGYFQGIISAKLLSVLPSLPYTEYNSLVAMQMLIWVLICIFLYVLGYYTHKFRHVERSGLTITADYFVSIIKYFAAIIAAIIIGTNFYSWFNSEFSLYLGYAFGALLGLSVTDLVFRKIYKSFTKENLAKYIVFTSVLIFTIWTIKTDLIGYAKYVPELNTIEKICFASGYEQVSIVNSKSKAAPYAAGYSLLPNYLSKDSISYITRLHTAICMSKSKELTVDPEEFDSNDLVPVLIRYDLNNGDSVCRAYEISQNEYKEFLAPLYETREYKLNNNEIFHLNPSHAR